jgi:hypothetical protein
MAGVSGRIMEQRARNRVIELLDLAGSFEQQIDYSWKVPIADVPHEVIEQWEDWVPFDPTGASDFPAVYSPQEVEALKRLYPVWLRASEALSDDLRPLADVHALPEWAALRDGARAAGAVFESRGLMPEDREVE